MLPLRLPSFSHSFLRRIQSVSRSHHNPHHNNSWRSFSMTTERSSAGDKPSSDVSLGEGAHENLEARRPKKLICTLYLQTETKCDKLMTPPPQLPPVISKQHQILKSQPPKPQTLRLLHQQQRLLLPAWSKRLFDQIHRPPIQSWRPRSLPTQLVRINS